MRYTYEDISKLGHDKYEGKYTYEPFEGDIGRKDTFTYTCPIHGQQVTQPRYHFKHAPITGCVGCGRDLAVKRSTKSLEKFVEDAVNLHGSKYDYSKFVYKGNKTKGIVLCNECGHEWAVTPNNHLCRDGGRGCPNCRVNSIYTEAYYRAHEIPDHPCTLYVVKLTDKETDEVFCKVGLTKHENIKYRFRGLHKHFNIDVCWSTRSTFFAVYTIEQELLGMVSDSKHQPSRKFKGHTECFDISTLPKVLLACEGKVNPT